MGKLSTHVLDTANGRPAANVAITLYAVDGGSEDGTVEYLKAQGIKVIEQPIRGYNHGYICAFENCSSDTLVVFHPKASR